MDHAVDCSDASLCALYDLLCLLSLNNVRKSYHASCITRLWVKHVSERRFEVWSLEENLIYKLSQGDSLVTNAEV